MPIGTTGAMLFAVGEPTDIAPFETNILDRVELWRCWWPPRSTSSGTHPIKNIATFVAVTPFGPHVRNSVCLQITTFNNILLDHSSVKLYFLGWGKG